MTHTSHAAADVKRLTRSRSDRQLAGVCGGVAAYTGVDATIVRLGVVLVTLFTWGLGAVAYLLAAIIMPEEPVAQAPPAEPTHATPTYTTPPAETTYPVTVPEPPQPQPESEAKAEDPKPAEDAKPTDTP